MTTIPTPVFIVLSFLAIIGTMGIFATLYSILWRYLFFREEKQRKKRETEQMHRSIEEYLQVGGK
jgi:hypothetical protein